MYRKRTLLLRALFSGFLFAPFFASAQIAGDTTYQNLLDKLLQDRNQTLSVPSEIQKSTVGGYLDVKTNPPTPGPNAPVQMTIESYLTDLYKANISWSLNGTVLSRGAGRTSFDFQTGPSGQTTYVSVTIITNTGEVITRNFSFTPVGVTIMWEADTYTPPFYKGKALLTPEANVRVVAIPEVAGIANPLGPGDLIYNWKKNDQIDSFASGAGKNSYSFVGPKPLSNTKISLAVSTIDDSAQSEMKISLPFAMPHILFYEKDPLLGILYNKPFDNQADLTKKELSLSAEPYFFSNQPLEGATTPTLKYAWSVNGKEVKNYGRIITLRNDTGTSGSSLVSLSVRGVTQTFQTSKKDLKVNFKEEKSSSLPFF